MSLSKDGTIVLAVCLPIILILIGLFLYLGFYYYTKLRKTSEADEYPLRHCTSASNSQFDEAHLKKEELSYLASFLCRSSCRLKVIREIGNKLRPQERIPVIGIAGGLATITLWMANRGIGEGYNILSDGTRYKVVINPKPKNVDGGVLLWDLNLAETQSWKTAQKPVLIEPKDPEHDRDWPDMAPSITSNMATIVLRVLIRQEEKETNIPIVGPL
ncbi:hypothetical protein NOF04DRAFT_1273520 [Fusarium oxysporum II5]|nr:hypothetical protein NOF04DRAFT_1273520 [Fusarium oxysporum II5]